MAKQEIVIKAKEIGKRYRIGVAEEKAETLAGQLLRIFKYPLRNLKRLRKLKKFSEEEEIEGINWALRGINFEVKRGEVLGIIGHNGAGKSTLLKILSRITEPTEGEVEIRGRVSSLLEVGTGFHPELSGRDNIYLNGTILGMTKKEVDAKFQEIVAFSGIGKYLDTPVKFYSSGMKVRLAFSVAAHLEPEILIIDEVLAVGDMEFQNKCLGKMDEVAHSGRTVLFVSHNMAAVKSLCSRTIVLKGGREVYEGSTDRAIQVYSQGENSNMKDKSDFYSNGYILESFTLQPLIENEPIKTADPLVLEGEISGPFPSENLILLIVVNSILGFRVLTLSSRLSGIKIQGVKELLKFNIELETIPLMPAPYTFDISVLSGSNGQKIASFEKVIQMKIEPSNDFLPIALPSISDRGTTYVKHKFRIDQE